jgi:hypothetical protein
MATKKTTKRIRVDVYPSGHNNAVKMETVPHLETPKYLKRLEQDLAPMMPSHRHGSPIFIIDNRPGRSLKDIADAIGHPELFSVKLSERPEEVEINKPKRSKRARLGELDEERAELRARLRALNKEARTIERKIARK